MLRIFLLFSLFTFHFSLVATAQTVAVKDHLKLSEQLFEVGSDVAGEYELLRLGPREMTPEERAEYNFRRGYVAFRFNEFNAARRQFELIGRKSAFYPHATYYRAYMEYADSNYVAARPLFHELRDDASYRTLVPYYLLQIEFAQGNYDYVAANAEPLVEQTEGPRRTELLQMASQAWFRLGQHGRALESMRAYRTEGGSASRLDDYMRGFSLYREGRWQDAAEALSQVVGADDSLSQNASYHLADSYLKLGDKERAAKSFSIAATSGHDAAITQDALLNYGKLLYETGGGLFNEAVRVLERYLADYPGSLADGEVRGMLQRLIYNHALETWKKGRNADGEPARSSSRDQALGSGSSLTAGAEAKLAFEQSTLYPENPRLAALARFWQGEIMYAEGDTRGAEAALDEYLRYASPSEREDAMARYDLGYIAFNEQRWGDAQTWFDDFLARHTASDIYRADAANRRGDIHQAGREYTRAIESYDAAAAIARRAGVSAIDQGVYAAYKRAVMLGLTDRTDDKVKALRQIGATSSGPYARAAMYELGRTLIVQEKYADGATVLKDFIAKYPGSDQYMSALTDLGLAYLNMGNRAESKRYYELAVAHGGGSREASDAMAGLRGIYVEEGDVDGYVDWAARAGAAQVTAAQRDSLSFASAERVYLSGDGERAVTALENYAAANPDGKWRAEAASYLRALYPRVKLARAERLGGEEAMALYRELAEDPSTPQGAQGAWRVIEDLYNKGEMDAAEAATMRLAESGTPHTFWLGKSFLLLGDIYVSRGDNFQARATYQSIVDGYTPADDGIIDAAKERIRAL